MTSYSDEDVEARFERETAHVFDVDSAEVIPPGATEPDAEEFAMPIAAFITEELCAAIFSVPANMMARKTEREWWRLEKEEEDLLGKATAPCLRFLAERYLGSEVGPFAGIGAALAVIYGPRILHEVQEREKEKREKERGAGQPHQQEQQHPTQRSSSSSDAEVVESQQSSSAEYATPYQDDL